MRRVVTGVGPDGRSRVMSDGGAPVAFGSGGTGAFGSAPIPGDTTASGPNSSVVHELWSLGADPSVTVEDPTSALESFVVDIAPGATKWIITEMGPGTFGAMHSTPTIDYGLVVRGDIELGLEDGSVHLFAGDAVVMNGVRHSWLAGPEGCVIATVLVGLRSAER